MQTEINDTISKAMADAHTSDIPAIGSPEMEPFLTLSEVVQTEEDVGGVPF